MKTRLLSKKIITVAVLFLLGSGSAFATVVGPWIDVQNKSIDAGTLSNSGLLTIDATAINIYSSPTDSTLINEDFRLSANYTGITGTTYNFNNGNLTIGSLLVATFNNLTIDSLGTDILGNLNAVFSSDLSYTGGSTAGSFLTGRIEGGLFNVSGNFDGSFTAANTIAVVGSISPVPLPAAIWLFGPALLGFIGFGRRKQV